MKRAIYWFRNNLRLRDNPSLAFASREFDQLLFVYVIDPRWDREHPLGFPMMGKYRRRFWSESLQDLKVSLEMRNCHLHIFKGDPFEIINSISQKTGIQEVVAGREPGSYENRDERNIGKVLTLTLYDDGFLYEPKQLPINAATLPFSFTGYRKKVEKHVLLRDEFPVPQDLCSVPFESTQTVFKLTSTPVHDSRSAHPFLGGESAAWARVEDYIWQSRDISHYKATRNKLIGTSFSSKFSAYLALGCISPVSIAYQIREYEAAAGSSVSTYWLIFEMMWRDYFRLVTLKFGSKVFKRGGIQEKKISFENDPAKFNNWCLGKTGQQFVDANMIELVQTGFMSNRGRQNAASYLIHDLRQDWRWGAAFFESHLVDYDCASNWCNWMYVAGIGNSRKPGGFDVQWQQDKYDSTGKYRELWL